MRCECGCECCSQPREITRGDLAVHWDHITWRGRQISEPTPAQRRVLIQLMRRPVASSRSLEVAAGSVMKGDAAPETVNNHLTRLRQWLVRNEVPMQIKNVRGIGYKLIEQSGSW